VNSELLNLNNEQGRSCVLEELLGSWVTYDFNDNYIRF